MTMTETKRPTRHVRVILEGVTVRPASKRTHLLLAEYAGGTFLLDTTVLGVTVEDEDGPRTWTDGDLVLQHVGGGITWERVDGAWRNHRSNVSYATDAETTEGVTQGRLQVLRYQAGE